MIIAHLHIIEPDALPLEDYYTALAQALFLEERFWKNTAEIHASIQKQFLTALIKSFSR